MAEPSNKISSAVLFEKLDTLQTTLNRLADAQFRPQPMYIYKPRGEIDGAALKCQLRLVPNYSESKYIQSIDGGLFLEIVEQTGKGEGGFATFGWQNDTRLTAKLGMPDIGALLAGYQAVRLRGKSTPANTRTRTDTEGTTVSMFHKFDSDSTVIEWKFAADGSFLKISKSQEWKRSIKLSLQEEILLEAYLRNALTACQAVGMR
jgi:hypothetical protein